jgi:hypothetical protein
VSAISLFGFDPPTEKSYVFSIDLLRRSQDPFVPGANWYTVRIRSIADAGSPGTVEQYRLLTAQIVIEAPLSLIDTISATEGTTGNSNRGVYWYENSFYWEEHTVDVLSNDQKIPLAMVAGDLNGDTKADVVIGLSSQEVRNIVVYYNLDNGITWRREFVNQYQQQDKYRAESLALGDLDGDGDADIVAGIRDQSAGGAGVGIIIFWNDGVWTTQVLNYAETPVRNQRSLAVGDMNNDGRPDIVAGDDAGKVKYYRNNVRGAFPIGIAGQFPPGDVNSFGAGVRLTTDANSAIGYNSLRLAKIEGVSADLNPLDAGADTTLDVIVGAGTNVLIYRTRIVLGTPSWTRYTLAGSGDWPLAGPIQSLAVADMNLDARIDIVAGINPPPRTSGVYRLRNMGMTGGGSPTFNTWVSGRLPHTTVSPVTGLFQDLGAIKDIALGDTDGDGDIDIVFIGDVVDDFVNNLWHLENVGDVPASYTERNVYTTGWGNRREKASSVEMDYVDL